MLLEERIKSLQRRIAWADGYFKAGCALERTRLAQRSENEVSLVIDGRWPEIATISRDDRESLFFALNEAIRPVLDAFAADFRAKAERELTIEARIPIDFKQEVSSDA